MSLISDKQIFYIDSNDRTSGTNGNFTYELNILGKFDYAVILQASIPKSYYLIQNGRNTFTIDENGSQATVTIPIGNYGRSSFRAQLQTSLNSASPNSYSYTVSIPNSSITADTGKYTFNVSNNGGVQPQFIIGHYMYEQLGLNANTTYSFVADELVSVNVVKFQLEDTVYINSDLIANKEDNVLQEVFALDSQDYGNILWVCPDLEAFSKPITNPNNSIYTFWVTDEDGVSLDLNGQNVVFTLMLYKKESVYSLLRNVIKMLLLR
jgi:hypothetical protein